MLSVAKAWRISAVALLILIFRFSTPLVAATESGPVEEEHLPHNDVTTTADHQKLKSLRQEAETIDARLEAAQSGLTVITDREKAVR